MNNPANPQDPGNTAALLEIESIKQLKARYCRYLDAKDWRAWRAIFADDFVSDTSAAGGAVVVGADEFVEFTRRNIGKPAQTTVHQVHAPEIELISPTTAGGVWALHDIVALRPGLTLHGYGHYDETYEKSGGRWRVKSSTLTRLREDIATPLFSIRVSERMRNVGARFARKSAGQPSGKV
ncbi:MULTISPECIES: nuclear transport factor 2 family protein [Nocardia]|uniref:nuclear transport factor 2 family protein n=1 Tax=Nocardia TaxID=1817 RepID=UPI000D689849|nr:MULTISPECIES: nuclear transport factor 2 family protein [Nocardia]